MSLAKGTYLILNVRQNNTAFLSDGNDGTPVVSASPNDKDKKQQWEVTPQGNFYTLRNISSNTYANTGTRAQADNPVEGRRPAQQFEIAETRVSGQFTIATTDTRVVFQLPDNQPGSPVILSNSTTDQRSWWIFQRLN